MLETVMPICLTMGALAVAGIIVTLGAIAAGRVRV